LIGMGWLFSKSAVSSWPVEIPAFKRIDVDVPPTIYRGGPGFLAQLEHARNGRIDTIICSALDGDPRLRLNAAVAAIWADPLIAGLDRLAELTGAKRTWIAVEENSPRSWVRALRRSAGRIEVIPLPNHYPQADPTMLLYTLTGRRLAPRFLPTEQGVLLLDAPTAAAFGDGHMTYVPLGVLDHRNGWPWYLEVPAGITLAAALRACGVGAEGITFLGGDRLRDHRLSAAHRVGEGDLTIHLLPPSPPAPAEPCIRCGWCAQTCPTRAAPAWLLEAAQRSNACLARSGGLGACIECGLCDQVCPAHLPLLSAIRQLKAVPEV
jgi:electron transport complex protein RnfC